MIRKLSESDGTGSPLMKSGCGYVGVHGGEMDLRLDCVWVNNGRKLVGEREREREVWNFVRPNLLELAT